MASIHDQQVEQHSTANNNKEAAFILYNLSPTSARNENITMCDWTPATKTTKRFPVKLSLSLLTIRELTLNRSLKPQPEKIIQALHRL